ncbi:hypothetical protein GGR58DRAFT_518310 [Xylaria digitata]|nr:hypothetical protein GGR58DRAFT_518310 [Xylaria digitata]
MSMQSILQKDSLGRTSLHFAVENMFTCQVSPFTDLDAADDFGRTALHIACAYSKGDRDTQLNWIERLSQLDTRIDLRDAYGLLAIDYAIIDQRQDIVQVFQTFRNLNIDGMLPAMKLAEKYMRQALDASSVACRRPGTEIEE